MDQRSGGHIMKKGFISVLWMVFIPCVLMSQTMYIHTNDGVYEFDLSYVDRITFSMDGTEPLPGDFLSWTGSSDPNHEFTLVRVHGTDGTVTNIGGFDYFPAMAYGNDGTLYGISNELHIINPANGSTVKIGSLTYFGSEILMCGAAFSPYGQLYVLENTSPKRVFTVNLQNGNLTYVGMPDALIRGIVFASNGTLYGVFADLFTLDPSDMSTLTTVGDTGYFLDPLTFDTQGVLFSMDNFPSTAIFSVNTNTGAANPVISVGSDGLQSLVCERQATPLAIDRMDKAVSTQGLAPRPSEERLLELEAAVKAARASHMNR
jgi:hypothetical protein